MNKKVFAIVGAVMFLAIVGGILFFILQPRQQEPQNQVVFHQPASGEAGVNASGAIVNEELPGFYLPMVGRGNTIGNIMNGGMIAQSGEWTYIQIGGHLYLSSLLRHNNITGEVEFLLIDDVFHTVNVIGDWVIYARYQIYKLNTITMEEVVISTNRASSTSISVVDGWVYYVTRSSTGIYRVKLDGSNHEQISDAYTFTAVVHDGWIYFRCRDSNWSVHKIKLDGSELTQLNYYDSIRLNIYDDWIFFVNRDKDNALYKMRTNGSDISRVIESRVNHINVLEGWIYFGNFDNNEYLYRVRVDGTEKEMVIDRPALAISLTDDWVYFINGTSGRLWGMFTSPFARVRRDGSDFAYVVIQ